MKALLKKYLLIFVVDSILLGYLIAMILVFLNKLGPSDDWKIANYCYYNINSEILDSSSSIHLDGNDRYFEYTSTSEEYGYVEKIRFTSTGSGSIGGYGYDTYLYGTTNNVRITFTLENASIYKFQFSDIKISDSDDDPSPSSLSADKYKVSKKDNVYTLSYSQTDNFYIYSVSILYLVKK